MPKTRASRRAAARAAERQLLHLSRDELACVLYHLPLAHDIALTKSSCRQLRDAARQAFLLRPYSGEVVTLKSLMGIYSVATLADGHLISCSDDVTRVWHSGVCVRTIENAADSMAFLPDGVHFITAEENESTAKLLTLDGALERSFDAGSDVCFVAAIPDGLHVVLALKNGEVRLYHVDGTLVHTFVHVKGLAGEDWSVYAKVHALAVTRDGQHIISGSGSSYGGIVKVWSVVTKSLVSNCRGHYGCVFTVAAMPDCQRILTGAADNTVRVYLLDPCAANDYVPPHPHYKLVDKDQAQLQPGEQNMEYIVAADNICRPHSIHAVMERNLEKRHGQHPKNTFSKLHTGSVLVLVALPDNQHALSGSRDHTVKLFNVNDGDVLRTFKHHTGRVTCLALLPDGLRFVSGSDDTTCIVYHGLAP